MSYEIRIDTNAAQAAAQLRQFPEAMAQGIARALDRENDLTVGHIQAKKLSRRGPTTLGVITNRLRGSIRRNDATISPDAIESAVGSNVVYAGVHEHGIDADVQVKGHTRRVFGTSGGGSTFNPKTGRISRGKPKRIVSGSVNVRAHTRHMRMPARAPFQTSVEERAENYSRSISGAVVAAWEGKS